VSEPVTAARSSNEMRRATRYLRWYPNAWRARYGEEFVAHLEAELEEQPISVTRSMNIALHGVITRFKLQASVRWISGIALTLVVVVAVIAGVLGSENRNIGVPLNLNTNGSIGVPVSPRTVTNINFQFTDRTTKVIRVTNVALIGFRGYGIPRIVRVRFDPKRQGKTFLLNPSNSTPGLIPALGHPILLGGGDSILVSLKAPLEGHLYAVGGLRLTYVRKGATHVKTLSLKQSPQLLCVERHTSSVTESPACQREFTTAWSLAQFYNPLENDQAGQTSAQREAWVATNAAFEYVSEDLRKPTGVNSVREWATTLFAHRGSWRIVRVTATQTQSTLGGTLSVSKSLLLFRLELQNRKTDATTAVCVQNGIVDSAGGAIDPTLMTSCK
jgi:hypothetical protein